MKCCKNNNTEKSELISVSSSPNTFHQNFPSQTCASDVINPLINEKMNTERIKMV